MKLRSILPALLISACMTSPDNRDTAMIPSEYKNAKLILQKDCKSFEVRYYAHPKVSVRDLENQNKDIGYGTVVIPKDGVKISQMLYHQTKPQKFGETYFIYYQPNGEEMREIAEFNLEVLPPSDASQLKDRPLFSKNGAFLSGGAYSHLTSAHTREEIVPSVITIERRYSDVYTADDGNSCEIPVPKITFRVTP